MSGSKQSALVGSGVVLAAALGLPAMAQERSLLEPDVATFESSAIAPISEAPPGPAVFAACPTCPPTYCPPCEPGFFGRWKQRHRAKCWGYPEEFCEPPLGSMVLGHQITQIANGQAARMALYQYDFVPASDQLAARGKAQVAKIAAWLPMNAFPVFVEPTRANPKLDELRRQVVWSELVNANSQFPIPSERVVLGRPAARGLSSADALLIDKNRLGQTSSRGNSAGGGTISSSTSSGTGGGTAMGTTGRNY